MTLAPASRPRRRSNRLGSSKRPTQPIKVMTFDGIAKKSKTFESTKIAIWQVILRRETSPPSTAPNLGPEGHLVPKKDPDNLRSESNWAVSQFFFEHHKREHCLCHHPLQC